MGKKAAYLKQALALIYFSFLPMLLMSNFEKDFNLLSQKLEALGKLDVLSLCSFSLLLEAFLRLHTFFFLSVLIDGILFTNIALFQHASMIELRQWWRSTESLITSIVQSSHLIFILPSMGNGPVTYCQASAFHI